MHLSHNLGLPYLQPSQAQKHVTHNTALERLDSFVQLSVEQLHAVTPPVSPADGEAWALGSNATGAWAGQEDRLAVWINGGWVFLDPPEGTRLWEREGKRLMVWSDGAWIAATGLDSLASLGVGTTADTTNRLAVAGPATLLTHDGAGHRLKINKAGTGDTASLVFQSDWSGRAEMGLAGNEDWSLKVSQDGSLWTEALVVAAATGRVTGEAVQSSATDVTEGRLMRADYGYGPGNLLGSVSESGGVPTGAVIEQGQNANGIFTRFADGTQICGFRVVVTPVAGAVTQTAFLFPAAFHTNGGATDEIFVTALPISAVPQTTVGVTGVTGMSSMGGTLTTWRTNTTNTHYSCLAFGRWF